MHKIRQSFKVREAPSTYSSIPTRTRDQYAEAILAAAHKLEAAIAKDLDRPGKPTTVYRFFDTDDRLLYVGITTNVIARMISHADAAAWFQQVAYSTYEHYPNRTIAKRREAYLIQTEAPAYNKDRPAVFFDDDELRQLRLTLSECWVVLQWPGTATEGYYEQAIDNYLNRPTAMQEHAEDERLRAVLPRYY